VQFFRQTYNRLLSHLIHFPVSLRDLLIERSAVATILYAFYLKWRFRKIRASSPLNEMTWDDRALRDRFENSFELRHKVERAIRRRSWEIPLAPNWLFARPRVVFGRIIQLSDFNWQMNWNAEKFRHFWKNLDIDFGGILQIAVRWDGGRRRYVAIRLWVSKTTFLLPIHHPEVSLFEFSHELYEVTPGLSVSKWWWGPGWVTQQSSGHHELAIYRHFGTLFRWYWKGRRNGFFGKELTAAQKEKVYYDFFKVERWDSNRRMYSDIITGNSRDFITEWYPAVCVDCHCRFNPDEYDFMTILRCSDCLMKADERDENDVNEETAIGA